MPVHVRRRRRRHSDGRRRASSSSSSPGGVARQLEDGEVEPDRQAVVHEEAPLRAIQVQGLLQDYQSLSLTLGDLTATPSEKTALAAAGLVTGCRRRRWPLHHGTRARGGAHIYWRPRSSDRCSPSISSS